MDLLESGLFDAPYNYTFNFWTDYLGLSTIVQEKRSELHPPAASLLVNNSITESLKATLGLEDDHHHHHHRHLHHLHQHHQHQHQHHHDSSSPGCPCVMGHGGDLGTHGGDSCCCSCSSSGGAPRSPAPPHPPPPTSIFDLKARLSLLRPPRDGDAPAPTPAERDTAAYREGALFGGAVATDLQGRGTLAAAAAAAASERRRRSGKAEPGKVCVFCRNNGAPEEVFASHVLKAADGRVLCPVLRAYTCPLCGANGDHAHTIKYCPLSRDQQPSHRAAKGPRTVHKSLAIF